MPPPFFYKERRDNGARLVAWASNLDQLRNVFYDLLGNFSENVEVLVKITRDATSCDKWQRFYGTFQLSDLQKMISSNETFFFHDGGGQVSIKNPHTDEYLTFDEHGILYVYSKARKFPGLFKQFGFEERKEKLISDLGHWHIFPKGAERLRQKFIKALHLEKLMTNWRYSKFFRITAFLILLNFFVSQILYAQDQFQVQDGTHLYTPVKEVNAERLDEKGTGSEILPSTTTASLPVPFSEDPLANPTDFWNESPLSPATPEIVVDEQPLVILSPSPVILSEAKDLGLRVNSAPPKDGSVRISAEKNLRDPSATPQDDTSAIASLTSFARNDGPYDFDVYSFEDALDLIRPEFAQGESVIHQWSPHSYGF